MSNYITKMRNIATGQIQDVLCLYEYFPSRFIRRMGYQPVLNGETDGEVLDENELHERFEDV